MLISKTSRYALQAAAFLAEHWEEEGSVPVGQIASELGVPRNYLSKILHQLARSGVLISVRGPSGGFRLSAAPGEIMLAQVVEPVEPAIADRHCLLGRPSCTDDDPCSAHSRWRHLSTELQNFLGETTLEDLLSK